MRTAAASAVATKVRRETYFNLSTHLYVFKSLINLNLNLNLNYDCTNVKPIAANYFYFAVSYFKCKHTLRLSFFFSTLLQRMQECCVFWDLVPRQEVMSRHFSM